MWWSIISDIPAQLVQVLTLGRYTLGEVMKITKEEAEIIIVNFVCQNDLTTLEINLYYKIIESFPTLKTYQNVRSENIDVKIN